MIIKSYDGNSFGTDYVVVMLEGEGIALPGVVAQMARRVGAHPLLAGVERQGRDFTLGISIEGADVGALRTQLMQWLDPEDEEAKQLVATDDDGSSNERYLECICERLSPIRGRGGIISSLYVAAMKTSDDARWRSTSVVTESAWNVTASGQTDVVNNQGEDEAYPVITVEPTSAKSGGFQYKRWCPIVWNATGGMTNYPIRLGPLNLSGKAQGDGDDIRVYVGGVERDRWLAGTLVTAVTAWINLDFEARAVAEVGTAIAGSGDVEEIESDLDISDFPSTGILLIDSEAFVYTGKSDVEQTFTGVTRAAKGTSMASHGVGTTIEWVQHDVWIYYGDSALSAPSVDDDYRPVFDLDASTNTVWDYDPTQAECDGFGESGVSRPGAWSYATLYQYQSYYPVVNATANHFTSASPWTDPGNRARGGGTPNIWCYGVWYLYNPCGITGGNFQSGEHGAWRDSANVSWTTKGTKVWSSGNGTSWTNEWTSSNITSHDTGAGPPAAPTTWESWSQNVSSITSGAKYVGFGAYSQSSGASASAVWSECADVVVTLDSTYTPDATVNSEQSNYSLAATITNQTTGKAITLTLGMELDEELEVDTERKVVTYLADGSGQRQALSTGGVRKAWLALLPGNNTLRYDETGVVAVTVGVEYRKRYYG